MMIAPIGMLAMRAIVVLSLVIHGKQPRRADRGEGERSSNPRVRPEANTEIDIE